MRKTRMISVIAASLLTATVVFTGCGGGGSSSTTTQSSSASSVSSTASSQSSTTTSGGAASSQQCLPGQDCGATSSSEAAVKKVIVSDGYVLGATVKCKTGENEPTAIATANPGEYEFNVAQCPAHLCAKDGFIDVNDNNSIDAGEPKAPRMTAPGSYTNINPYTTLIANGMTPAEVAEAFGLDANTNFDTPVPESTDAAFVKNAVLLSAMLSYIESCSSTRGMLPVPGTDAEAAPSSTSAQQNSTPASAPATTSNTGSAPCTLADLIQALKGGNSIEDLLPAELKELPTKLSSVSPDKADDVAAPFIARLNGAYEAASSSSQASSASTGGATEGEILPTPEDTGSVELPGQPAHPAPSSSSEATSSSEASSSEGTSSSEGGLLPTPGDTVSSASEATSSSEASSSEESSSSEEVSSSEESSSSEAEECLPGEPCGSSSSEEVSSSEESSSSEASSSSTGGGAFVGISR